MFRLQSATISYSRADRPLISQAYLYDHDDQFVVPGWNLDVSWYLATLSAAISLITAGSLVGSAFLMRPEGDYEFLEDPVNP